MKQGEIVGDRFEVVGLAGTGGMGSVFRARDRHTGAQIALKVLVAEAAAHAERFTREAALLAELRHPTIVRYVDRGVTASGAPFLAMEWLEGPDLAARLAAGPLPLGEALTLGIKVSDALGVAHDRGVVHRDLKPSNLILVGGAIDRVKLVDFGLARLGRAEGAMTIAGMVLGTPGYMAPEQARGEVELDPRADVFSLGCLLFECLTGRKAFPGSSVMAVLAKVLVDEAPRLEEAGARVPRALSELVRQMLAKPIEQRPAHGWAVKAALEAIAAEHPDTGELMAAAIAPPAHGPGEPETALTTGERRVVCLALVPPQLQPAAPAADGRAASGSAPIPADSGVTGGASTGGTVVLNDPTGNLALHTAITRHGGHLDVLLDGSMLITFTQATTSTHPSAPLVRYSATATDRAVQAARFALDLRSVLRGSPIALVAGWATESDRVHLGDAIDRGAALVSEASDGTIRLTPTIAALLDARFEVLEDRAGLLLRSERGAATAVRTLLGKSTACVGRTRELGMLLAHFEECVSEPMSRAVVVSGEAGLGKSRLRHELIERIAARADEVQIWLGRGDPMSAGAAFGLVGHALRRVVGSSEAQPLAYRQHKLQARVSRTLEGEDALRVAAFLGELVGVRFPDEHSVQLQAARRDARLMGDQIRRAVEDFLQAECAAGPVLLVLEDVHYGDLPSIRLVETLLRNLCELPFMLLACGRPEIRELFPTLCTHPGTTHLVLGKLSRKHCEKLAHDVLGEAVDDSTIARVVDQADGNAFFLEELIRAAAQHRAEALPETVLAMLQARLEALEPAARRVLRAGSVFGRRFTAAGVGHLLGGERAELELGSTLEALVGAELVSRGEGAVPGGAAQYVFRQASVQEAAYAMLTDADRSLGHRLAAEWLEQSGQADPLALAEHFERGGQPERAVGWLWRAAKQALSGDDFDAAVDRAERGIACSPPRELLGALRLVQAEALGWRGQLRDAQVKAMDAVGLLEPGTVPWYEAMEQGLVASGGLGEYERVAALAQELTARHVPGRATGPEIRALCTASVNATFGGNRELASALLDRIAATQAARAEADPATQGAVYRARGMLASLSGDPAAAMELHDAAVRCFDEAGDLRQGCRERGNVGFTRIELGDFGGGETVLLDALRTAHRMGLDTMSAHAKQNLCLAYERQGRAKEACAMGRDAAEAARLHGNRRQECGARIYLAQALARAGDLAAAESEARAAIEMAPAPYLRVEALPVLASVLLGRGHIQGARLAAEQAMQGLVALTNLEEGESLLRLIHAETLYASGEQHAARGAIRAARARLLERASHIADPAWRRSFLERVPENARTLALSTEWAGEPPVAL
jgi:eukaryotic-like serine/threonine-protein kinase